MNKPKLTIDQVRKIFAEHSCELLSNEYTGITQSLSYKCHCGNISSTSLHCFRIKGKRCKKCASVAATQTSKIKNGGEHHFQTKNFRKQYKRSSLKKYGTLVPSQSIKVKNKMKKTFMKKYGVKYVSQIDGVQQKKEKTSMAKYGTKYRLQNKEEMKKHINLIQVKYGVPSMAYLSKCASKESQSLFKSLYRKLSKSQREKCYFADLNHEFVTTFEGKTYKYDFVHTNLKRCIEYNGYNFHPRPDQKESEIGWCAFHPNKTVKEARAYEKHKYQALTTKGYEIMTVWDYEFKKDQRGTIIRCLNFLLS